MYTFEEVCSFLGGYQLAMIYYGEIRIYYVMHTLNNNVEEAQKYKIILQEEDQKILEKFTHNELNT